jgi:hypothetical protein
MPNVTLNLDGETIEKAKAAAATEFRSLSQQVAFLIERDTARRMRRIAPGTTAARRRKPSTRRAAA